MATAVVQEQQLLKTLRWYDGFVIALANPGFLLGVARLLRRRSRRLGRRDPVGNLRGRGRLHQHDLLGARDHVPGEVRRPRALRPRGLAEVHDPRRAGCDVRLLDRLVGRALRQRPLHRLHHPEHVVLGRAGRQLPRRRRLLLGLRPDRVRAPGGDRDRAHPLRLAVQRLRRARRGALRLRRRRPPDDPAVRDDDPAVPERELRQRQPDEQPERPRAYRGAASSSRSSGSG